MMKRMLREQMIAMRKKLSKDERARADQIIAGRVRQLPEWGNAQVICVYESISSEVSTLELKQSGKTILFPDDKNAGSADLYIVPGVAFDKKGNRLGRGKGWYDKLLKDVRVPKIGLAYSFQMVAEVPHTSYDVPMDMVVTETGIYENKTP